MTIMLVTSAIWGQCTDGCLRCNKIDENSSDCLICDAPAFYVPFGKGLCIKLEVEGCEVPTVDRSLAKCLRCKTGYIFDTTTDTCKEVANKIDRCLDYDASAACQFCEAGYYLDSAACVAVPADKLKSNCAVYNADASACVKCGDGYYLNAKAGTCDSISKVTNCIAYSQNQCDTCEAGYIKNENLKMSLKLDENFIQNVVAASVSEGAGSTFFYSANVNNCQKTTVLNCTKFETFDKCTECAAGHVLEQEGKKCTMLPQEPIKNCKVYSNATTCQTCLNASWMNVNVCQASTIVEHCEVYSHTSDACDECKYGYYLSGGACVERTMMEHTNQCKTFKKDADLCDVCNPNFVLTTSMTGCLPIIPGCKVSSVSGNVVSCSECNDGLGLSGSSCVNLDIEFCAQYDLPNATCLKCQANYYKNGSSTQCLPSTVQNCEVKSEVADECVTCKTHFFVDASKSNHCSMQNIANCKTFQTNANVCTACLDGFFLEGGGTSCGLYTLRNCDTPDPAANLCTTCKGGYYKDDSHPDNHGCSLQSRQDCGGYDPNTNVCSSCANGYYLKDDLSLNKYCEKKNKTGCMTYDNTDQNDNCTECNLGFFLENDACTAQAITECDVYEDKQDLCKTCNNLFYPNTNLCSAVTNPDCITTNGENQECVVCAQTHYLVSAGKTCASRRTGTANVDPACTGNKHTADTSTCTECPDGQVPFTTSIYPLKTDSITNISAGNCMQFHATQDVCLQCKEGYGSDGANPNQVCAAQFNSASDNCKLKTSGNAAETLATPGNCQICKDEMYSDANQASGTCTARTFLSSNCLDLGGVDQLDTAADACEYCAEGTTFAANQNFAVCVKHITAITGCQTYDLTDTTDCLSCTDGPDSSGLKVCPSTVNADGVVFNALTIASNNISVVPATEADASTAIKASCTDNTFLGINELGNINCAVCDSAKPIKKIGYYDTTPAQKFGGRTFLANQSDTARATPNADKPILPFLHLPATDGKCYAFADITGDMIQGKRDNRNTGDPDPLWVADPITFTGSANFAHVIEFQNYTIPIACKKDFFPSAYVVGEWTSTASSSDTQVTPGDVHNLVLTNCTAYTDPDHTEAVKKRFVGLGYGTSSVIPLDTYIHYDSCILDSDIFFFAGQILTSNADLGGNNSIYHVDVASTTDPDQMCVPGKAADGSAHTIVDNCQIYLNADNDKAPFDSGAVTTLKCLSCAPGYKAGFDSDGIAITSCTKIANCDMSNDAANTWMNMCETCEQGYSWNMSDSVIKVHLDKCTENKVDNCQVVQNNDATKCMICKEGYMLSDANRTACVEIKINKCEKTNLHNIEHLTTGTVTLAGNKANLAALNAFLHWSHLTDVPQYKQGCSKCAATFFSASNTAATPNFCTGSSNIGTAVADCEVYGSSRVEQCVKCKEGMVVVDTGSGATTCAAKAADGKEEHCMVKDAAGTVDGSNCTMCTGFRSQTAGTCYEYANCEIIEAGACKQCKQGYWPAANGFDCEGISPNDICEIYQQHRMCVKCKDGNTSPVNLMNGNTLIQVYCVKKYGKDDAGMDTVNTDYVTMFTDNAYKIDVNSGAVFTSPALYRADAVKYLYSTHMNSTAVKPLHSVCIDVPEVTHCKTENPDNSGRCVECADGYKYVAASNTCIDGPVENCITYDGSGTCVKCDQEHYVDSGQCIKRTLTLCKTFEVDKDLCTDCQPDQWHVVENSAKRCHEYTIQNCKERSETADTCSDCEAGIRYLDSGDCKLFTKQYCKTFSTTEDKCTACNGDRWLDSATTNTHECMEYTVQNCDGYEAALDKCTACLANYYPSGDDCVAPTAVNCLTRNATSDVCDTCVAGTWKNSNVCETNTAENCKTKSTTVNECTECLPAHWMDAANSNVCKPHTALNCNGYKVDANECQDCADNFYKNGTVCDHNTVMHCSSRSKIANECIVCDTDYWLNTSSECSEVTNTTCLSITPNTNNCASCVSTRYNDIASGMCKELTVIENCSVYMTTQDMCSSCSQGFYKSADSKSCIPNPDGIFDCTRYSDMNTCAACKPTHYLLANECKLLTQTAVTNCLEYSGDGICAVCEATHSLEGTACETNVATGCLTWANKDACATCPPNALLNAGACTATAITGCAVTSGSVGSEVCVTCDADKFLSTADNTCTVTSTTITGCVMYSGDGVCGKCGSGLIVSADGSACNSINKSVFGENCSTGSTNGAPKCAFCGAGYLMDDSGACSVSCSASNCFICNPEDNEKCNLCNTGYHMTPEMVCEENNRDEGVVRSSVVVMLALVLAMIKWDN